MQSTPNPSSTPEESTPGDTATNAPGDTAIKTPGDTATKTPGDTAIKTPGDTATKTPGDTATKTPGDTATKTPGGTATKTSGDATKIALDLLYDEAKRASNANDSERFDAVINKILAESDTSTTDTSTDRPSHEVTMDRWRVSVSVIMIIGLFVIVALVIFSKVQNGATEYVSLMSGLAGIALGWLFGTGAATNLRRSNDGGDSTSTRSRRAQGR
jgi:hypothetical protein